MPENGQEKTEEATPKRRSDARKKGQIARSSELSGATGLLVGVLVMHAAGPLAWNGFSNLLRSDLSALAQPDLTAQVAVSLLAQCLLAGALAVLPILAAFMAGGLVAGVVQTGGLVSMNALAPKFDRLNPMSGVKRIFSPTTAFEVIKMIARLAILGAVMWSVIPQVQGDVLELGRNGLLDAPAVLGDALYTLMLRVAMAGGVLAAADFAFQRWKFNRDLKMSKQEVKEEMRQLDGDPQIKQRIRRVQREMAKKRMMQEVPKATVVLANPTHFAVALRYTSGKMRAPVVVAKGQDHIAQQIKALAREHNVPVVENPPLARALHASVKLNQEVPPQLYRAVAEVLAFVYKLKRRW